jgi:hypothetical protein
MARKWVPKEEYVKRQNARRSAEMDSMSRGQKYYYFTLKKMSSEDRTRFAQSTLDDPSVSRTKKAELMSVIERKTHWFSKKR